MRDRRRSQIIQLHDQDFAGGLVADRKDRPLRIGGDDLDLRIAFERDARPLHLRNASARLRVAIAGREGEGGGACQRDVHKRGVGVDYIRRHGGLRRSRDGPILTLEGA